MVPQNRISGQSELSRTVPGQYVHNMGLAQQQPMTQGNVVSIDLVGPLLRRKILILLLTMLGCGLAYFAFTIALNLKFGCVFRSRRSTLAYADTTKMQIV